MGWVVQGGEDGKSEEDKGQVGCTEKREKKLQKDLVGDPSVCSE